MRRSLFAHAFFCASFAAVLAGCADSEESKVAANGVVANIEGQLTVLQSKDQIDQICRDHECEPNYIYSASFGRRRNNPSPPVQPPAPVPPPITTPFPVPQPDPNQEWVDYSKAILGLEKAWKISEGSRDVLVAVIDTGIQVDHPDLKENIWVNEAELNGRPGVDDDRNGYVDDVYGWDFANGRPNAFDDQKHGTHCAGIIGAEKNGLGTIGVSPKVKIMPVKFLNSSGQGDLNNAVLAIDYAVKMGARVLSNSWGGGGASKFLAEAIQRANAQGVTVVAAAGNESNNNDANPTYPASYPGVIAVASTDARDQISSFSNFGNQSVWIAAPGSQIFSSVVNGWDFLSGTSMATPQVTGALALALSVQPKLTTSDLQSLLCKTADAINLGATRCGRMNVGSLITAASQR